MAERRKMALYLRKVIHPQADDNYRVILKVRLGRDRVDWNPAQRLELGN